MTSGAFSATWARSDLASVATMPPPGTLERQRVDPLLQARDQQCLRVALGSLAAQFELQAVLLQAPGLARHARS